MMLHRRRPLNVARARGAALIVLMALLAMGVLYFVTVQLEAISLYQREAEKSGSGNSMVQAREALLGYAATYRDNNANEVFGYLPCPDTNGDGIADTILNSGECGSSGHASVGLLPYRTLGLSDLRDVDGNCLWYAVSGNFKAAATKATPINWDTQGQFSVVDGNGTILVAPDDGQGGAAAIIFAAGPPLTGQNRIASAAAPCNVDPTQVAAYLDGTYTFAAPSAISLIRGPVKDAGGNVTNNDRLAWITPKEIFDRVIKRQDFSNALTASPVGHLNRLTDEIKAVLEKRIQDDLVAGTTTNSQPTNTGSFSQFTGKQVGTLPTTLALNDGNYTNYYDNWSAGYRQAICSTLSTPCLTVAGTACRGALMFGGRGDGGRPRTTAEHAYSTTNLDAYFEAGSGREILNSPTTTFAGKTAYSETSLGATPDCAQPASCTEAEKAARRSGDVGTCLFPGEFKSFAQDIAAFAAGVTYSGTPSVSVDSSAKTVTLGDATSGGPSVGCVWHATPLALSTSMRLYFRLQFTTKGDGFALALADGATNLAPNSWARPQIMCGAADSFSLGYAGSPTSTTPGIEKPKLGIEFDTLYSTTRNDPPGDHMAFVYWGTTTDTDGSDDNTHYIGIGSLAVTTAAWAAGTATLTTATDHGLADNQVVQVSGISPAGYNATATITAHTANTLSFTLASNPGAYVSAGQVKLISNSIGVSNAAWSGGTATLTTPSGNGLAASQVIQVSGVAPTGYNGTVTVTARTPTTVSYALAGDPGAFVQSSGRVELLANTFSATNASWASGTATVTTSSAHGFAVDQVVRISGITPGGYNGTVNLTGRTATTFSYALASNPGSFSSAGQVKAVPAGSAPRNPRVATATRNAPVTVVASGLTPLGSIRSTRWLSGAVTIVTDAPHGLSAGDQVIVSGVIPSTYNGTFKVTGVLTSPSRFRYSMASDPGFYISGGTANKVTGSELSALTWPGPGALATAPVAHGLLNGENITTFGMTPNAYGTTANLTLVNATQFTYPLANPGGSFSTETPVGMVRVPGDTHFSTCPSPCKGFPTATTIYVRLDLNRRYDATNHVAVLDMKAYAGDLFPLGDACTPALMQDLSRDLSALCPGRTVTLQQDSIPINALAAISGITWLSGTATVTTAAAHSLVSGASVTISGASPITYNGVFPITVTGANTFTYAAIANPGIYVSGGDIEPLSTFYFGFTNARGSSNAGENQSITIYNLLMRSQ